MIRCHDALASYCSNSLMSLAIAHAADGRSPLNQSAEFLCLSLAAHREAMIRPLREMRHSAPSRRRGACMRKLGAYALRRLGDDFVAQASRR